MKWILCVFCGVWYWQLVPDQLLGRHNFTGSCYRTLCRQEAQVEAIREEKCQIAQEAIGGFVA